MDNYHIIKKLGQGAFSKVYLAQNKKNEFVAIKVYPNQKYYEFKIEKTFFDHSNMTKSIRMLDWFQTQHSWCIVLEYFPYTLKKVRNLMRHSNHPIKCIKQLFYDIIVSVQELHNQGWIHTDIKIDNILIQRKDKDGYEVKLSDFNSSVNKNNIRDNYISPVCYRSPEILLGLRWNEKVDIFSCACTFYRFITNQHLFSKRSTLQEKLLQMKAICGPFPHHMIKYYHPNHNKHNQHNQPNDSVENIEKTLARYHDLIGDHKLFLDLILKMTIIDPSKRWSASEILNHPWFHVGYAVKK